MDSINFLSDEEKKNKKKPQPKHENEEITWSTPSKEGDVLDLSKNNQPLKISVPTEKNTREEKLDLKTKIRQSRAKVLRDIKKQRSKKELLTDIDTERETEKKNFLENKNAENSSQEKTVEEYDGWDGSLLERAIKFIKDAFDYGDEFRDIDNFLTTQSPGEIISFLIRHALLNRVSSVHIEAGKTKGRVRFRFDGHLIHITSISANTQREIIKRLKKISGISADNKYPEESRAKIKFRDKHYDFFISVLKVVHGEKAVIKIFDSDKHLVSIREMGYNKYVLKKIFDFRKKKGGLMLFVGVGDCAHKKSMASLLKELNSAKNNICTLEDPIEYVLEGVNQTQLKREIGFDFVSGLKSIERQDPDVVMISEVNSQEVLKALMEISVRGNLALSSINADSSLDALKKIREMNIDPFLFVSSFRLVVCQRLVRVICPHCKEKREVDKEEFRLIKESLNSMPFEFIKEELKGISLDKIRVYYGRGCAKCSETGFLGRTIIAEALEINDDLAGLIHSSEEITKQKLGKTQAFYSVEQDGVIKMLKGTTTPGEVFLF